MKSIAKKILCCLLVVVVLVSCFFAVDAYRTHKAHEKVVIEFKDWSEEEIAEIEEHDYYVVVSIMFSYPHFDRVLSSPDEREEYNAARKQYYDEKNQQMSERFGFPIRHFSSINGAAYISYDDFDEFYENLDYLYSLAEDSYISKITVYIEDPSVDC